MKRKVRKKRQKIKMYHLSDKFQSERLKNKIINYDIKKQLVESYRMKKHLIENLIPNNKYE